jgi:protein gp37
VFTCLTSDFFLEEADPWRDEAWAIMRQRPDVQFSIITKRIVRLTECLPPDWGDGYPNVTIGATVESQRQAEIRLPALLAAPIQRRFVICEPLLEAIDLSPWLDARIAYVMVGGESGSQARVCDYDWVLGIRKQCVATGVGFVFKQTGARFRKDGRVYTVARHVQMAQAHKAGIDTIAGILGEDADVR